MAQLPAESSGERESDLRATITLDVPGVGPLTAEDHYPAWMWNLGSKAALEAIFTDLRASILQQIDQHGWADRV